MDDQLIAKLVEVEAIKAEIEGMKAENQYNQYRASRGETIAYTGDAFMDHASHLHNIAKWIMGSDS